jgi:hypothetical protein
MMAAVMTAAPAFHIGDTIEIETLLNGRKGDKNSLNFLSDPNSIKLYVVTQLPKGTLGKIENIHPFKKTGNTGLYITITSGPNAGKKYWVLDRKGKHYLKLYDSQAKETESVQEAKTLETQKDMSAVQDRLPAAKAETPTTSSKTSEGNENTEAAIAKKIAELTAYVSSAGETPKPDCQQNAPSAPSVETSAQPEALTVHAPQPVTRDDATFFLRPTEYAQADTPQIQSLAMRLTEGKKDDLSKVMAIHDWVASNVKYDTDAYINQYRNRQPITSKFDALSVLNNSPEPTAVCAGYANLTIALLRASNIPAREIEGLGHFKGRDANSTCEALKKDPLYHPQRHAWVEAAVNGIWVPLDTSADAGYTDITQREFIPSPSRKYMDPVDFDKSHTPCLVSNIY